MATIALMAALADGTRTDVEREKLRELFTQVGVGDNSNVYNRVVLRQTTLDDQIGLIGQDGATKEQTFEMAVTVCNADGVSSPEEQLFLDYLRGKLRLDESVRTTHMEPANQIAGVDIAGADVAGLELTNTAGGAPLAATLSGDNVPAVALESLAARDEMLNETVVRYSVIAAALELLPQSLATVGILPIQTKLVYNISRAHGFSLDKRQILDFIGVIGVGGAGQVVEGLARKLFGGLIGTLGKSVGGSMVGGILGGATGVATSAALTFATTYAMGQVSKTYYAQNRSISAADLKRLFAQETEKAKSLYATYAPRIQQQSQTLSVTDIPRLLRGSTM